MNEESIHIFEIPDTGGVIGNCTIGTVRGHTLLVAQVVAVQHVDGGKAERAGGESRFLSVGHLVHNLHIAEGESGLCGRFVLAPVADGHSDAFA